MFILGWTLAGCACLALLGVLGVTLIVRGSWPRHGGTVALRGIRDPVEVIRDRYGVPHIYAACTEDLFFGQGYVHAQDRLFQMDLQRRAARGQLAELFGHAAVRADRTQRIIGLNRSATRDLDALDEDATNALTAYTAGVNAAIALGRRPLEYRLLRTRPRPWAPIDTLAWAKLVQWDLSEDWYFTLHREKILAKIGADRMATIFPDVMGTADFSVVPDDEARARSGHLPSHTVPENLGSNAWAVSGARTESGKPILANDMHLPFTMPGTCYEIGLHSPDYECAGISLPGLLGVLIGHNARVAWGIANVRCRTQDIYIERLNPQDPDQYQVGETYEPFQVIEEHITVRGTPEPETVTCKLSRHGPVISEDGLTSEPDRVLTLKAQPLCEPTSVLTALLRLGAASNWEEFTGALRFWDAPTASFVYADVDGNIGSYSAGRVPIRACGPASTPLAGWTDDNEWVGTIPFADLPHALNPPDDAVVCANARPAGADYPYFLAAEWCTANREHRLLDLVTASAKFSVADMHAMQLDTKSPMAQRLTPFLTQVPATSDSARRAQELLRTWDGDMAADSAPAGIYQLSLRMLVTGLVGPAIGADNTTFYLAREQQYSAFVDSLLDEPENTWWTADGRSRDGRIADALEQAVSWWTERVGPDPASWAWGSQHQSTFRHPVYDTIPLIRRFGNARVGPVPGDSQTVFATAFLHTFESGNGPVQRLVVDLNDWDSHQQMAPAGQSGHLGHRHYRDQMPLWLGGGLHPLPWTRQAVERIARNTLRLMPG